MRNDQVVPSDAQEECGKLIDMLFRRMDKRKQPAAVREPPHWLFFDHTIYPICSNCGCSTTYCAEQCPNCNAEMSNPEKF